MLDVSSLEMICRWLYGWWGRSEEEFEEFENDAAAYDEDEDAWEM
jgi:hypothetical protein